MPLCTPEGGVSLGSQCRSPTVQQFSKAIPLFCTKSLNRLIKKGLLDDLQQCTTARAIPTKIMHEEIERHLLHLFCCYLEMFHLVNDIITSDIVMVMWLITGYPCQCLDTM